MKPLYILRCVVCQVLLDPGRSHLSRRHHVLPLPSLAEGY